MRHFLILLLYKKSTKNNFCFVFECVRKENAVEKQKDSIGELFS